MTTPDTLPRLALAALDDLGAGGVGWGILSTSRTRIVTRDPDGARTT